MNKTRLEAFSDRVFAIVITLLILDVKLPETDYSHLKEALIKIAPNIIAYVMSFLLIGLYWVGHHQSFQLVGKTDRLFLWMNTFFLLFLSFIPFPTSLLGRYPFKQIPIFIYGLNLVATNIVGFIMVLYIYYHKELASPHFTKAVFNEHLKVYGIVNAFYIFAIAISFISPIISYIIYIMIMIILIFIYGKKF